MGMARAAEISGKGLIPKNSFIHSIQRGCVERNILPRSAPSIAPIERSSFSSCMGK